MNLTGSAIVKRIREPRHTRRLVVLLGLTWLVLLGCLGGILHRLVVISNSYEQMFTAEMRQKDLSRQTQVAFKKQVQEWKDMLLRGRDAEDLARYTSNFLARQAETAELAERLHREAVPELRALVEQFQAAHRQVGRNYEKARVAYQTSGAEGYRTADHMVRGQDRPLTELIDEIVAGLDRRVEARRTALSLQLRDLTVGVLVVLVLVAALYYLIARTLRGLRRAGQSLSESEETMHRVFLNSRVGIATMDEQGCISHANPAACEILGYSRKELAGRLWSQFAATEDVASAQKALESLKAGVTRTYTSEHRYVRKDGASVWIRKSVSSLRFGGNRLHSVAFCEDITEQRRLSEELAELAFLDTLTRLPNRASFDRALEAAIAECRTGGRSLALICFDLDGFKLINDTCGRGTGDVILKEAAERMKCCVGRGDVLARLGGDEFALLFEPAETPYTPTEIARVVLDQLSLPFIVAARELFVTASAGVSVYPRDASDAQELLRKADAAMYSAKMAGRNGVVEFSRELERARGRRLELETDLRHALDRNEIALWFQPIYAVKTQKLVRFEALCRWHHPVLGMISPMELIPIAEETGLIVSIGRYVLQEACGFAVACRSASGIPIQVAVNVSTLQIDRPDFVATVSEVLAQSGLEPSLLDLELTESLLLRNPDGSVRRMHELKALGVRLSIDDFGTGYSSLSYLQKMPIDGIKIDRSFVADLDQPGPGLTLIRSIVAMAHALRMGVVAEGVETDFQMSQLVTTGCDELQGFRLGRPEPEAVALTRYLTEVDGSRMCEPL